MIIVCCIVLKSAFSRQAKASKLSLVFWLIENVQIKYNYAPQVTIDKGLTINTGNGYANVSYTWHILFRHLCQTLTVSVLQGSH